MTASISGLKNSLNFSSGSLLHGDHYGAGRIKTGFPKSSEENVPYTLQGFG
jgi:hypothetical protein